MRSRHLRVCGATRAHTKHCELHILLWAATDGHNTFGALGLSIPRPTPVHAPTETLPSPMAFTASTEPQRVQPDTITRKPTRPRKAQANPNRVRNELRFELAYLREKAAQLEQELASMQNKSRINGASTIVHQETTPSPTVVIVPHGGSYQERDAWKGIAGRQRKRREDAERENTRLKLIVERQRKTAVDLANLLRKRVRLPSVLLLGSNTSILM